MRTIFSFFSHFFCGVITILSFLLNPVIPMILFFTFMIYEVDEDFHISDEAFIDIREFGYGAFLTAVILISYYLSKI